MPSFRAQLNIVSLRPGPVMEAAVESLAARHHVEANQLDIVAGTPRITLRFTVGDDEWDGETRRACESAARMRAAVEAVAVAERLVVLRRIRGRWSPMRHPGGGS